MSVAYLPTSSSWFKYIEEADFVTDEIETEMKR